MVTPEAAPLEIFGRRAAAQTSALLAERDIDGPHRRPAGRVRRRGACASTPARHVEADAVITLPRLEGRRISGIPHDEDGFVPVDEHGAVSRPGAVYAAGRRQLPALQAGRHSPRSRPTRWRKRSPPRPGSAIEPRAAGPRMRAVLWTGQGPRYLYGRRTAGRTAKSSTPQPAPPGTPARRQADRPLPLALVDSLLAESSTPAQAKAPRPSASARPESRHDGAVSDPARPALPRRPPRPRARPARGLSRAQARTALRRRGDRGGRLGAG